MCSAASSTSITRSQLDESGFCAPQVVGLISNDRAEPGTGAGSDPAGSTPTSLRTSSSSSSGSAASVVKQPDQANMASETTRAGRRVAPGYDAGPQKLGCDDPRI